MDPIEIMLKEYEALRQEILTAMGNRNSILSFGQATIGVLLTISVGVYAASGSPLLLNFVLVLVVPTIASFTLFMWLGEYQRMQRAGNFLVQLEHKINDRAQEKLLTWETKLREQEHHMKYPYNTTVAMLVVVSAISLIVGLLSLEFHTIWLWILVVVGVTAHLAMYIYAVSVMSKVRLEEELELRGKTIKWLVLSVTSNWVFCWVVGR